MENHMLDDDDEVASYMHIVASNDLSADNALISCFFNS
jgi:hypothetical protein